MYALAVISFALLVCRVARAAAPLSSQLTRRQTTLNPSDIPSQCTSQCAPGVNYLNTCGENVACLCSGATNAAFYACLECVVGVEPSVKAALQTTLSEYEYDCGAAGATVSLFALTYADGATGGAPAPTAGSGSGTGGNPNAISNPLARNGGAVLAVSVAACVAGCVGAALAVLL